MKIKFANGVVKECISPTEQKIFRNVNSENPMGTAWVLHLKLVGLITSTELDELLNTDNIQSLEFSVVTEGEEEKSLFKLEGYEKVTSSVIRYAEDITYTELQLTKGL